MVWLDVLNLEVKREIQIRKPRKVNAEKHFPNVVGATTACYQNFRLGYAVDVKNRVIFDNQKLKWVAGVSCDPGRASRRNPPLCGSLQRRLAPSDTQQRSLGIALDRHRPTQHHQNETEHKNAAKYQNGQRRLLITASHCVQPNNACPPVRQRRRQNTGKAAGTRHCERPPRRSTAIQNARQ